MNQLYQPFQPLLTHGGQHRFGLTVQQHPARKSLAGVVHSYLQVAISKPTPYTVIPDGSQAIFISAESIRVGGAHRQALDVQIQEPGDYFGIRFYPGALRHFFNLNLSDITDQFVGSDYFPCRYFGDLHYYLYREDDFRQRVRVCDQWLLRHFTPQPFCLFDAALALIYQSVGNVDIVQLAKKIGVSRRHLNRLFQQFTGLSTKAFAQIIRLQSACQQLYVNPDNSLEIAATLGFFDQAHLLRQYKRDLLLNPRSLAKRFMSDFYNHQGK